MQVDREIYFVRGVCLHRVGLHLNAKPDYDAFSITTRDLLFPIY